MVCKFCERDIEVTEACKLVSQAGHIQLVRTPDGLVHQFLDGFTDAAFVKRLQAARAFVLPPRPLQVVENESVPPEPPQVAAPEPEPAQVVKPDAEPLSEIAAMAKELEEHWRKNDR